MKRHAIAALLVAACGGDEREEHTVHAHEDEQGHHDHHHGAVVAVTVWSDSLELFAEWAPAVAGQPSEILAHVTTLEDFRALTAPIRLTLEGPQTITVEAEPVRLGVFEVTVTPPAPGVYRGRLEVIGGDAAIDGFELVAHPTRAAAEASVADEEAGGITLLKEQQWRVPFDTAPVRTGRVAPTVEVPGELTTPPHGSAHVHAPVAGRVMAGRGGFPTPGREVREREELATLAPTPGAPEDATRAELAVVDAQAALEAARAERDRVAAMRADQAVPERRVEEAERSVRVAEAGLAAARRARSLYAAAERGRGRGTWRITAPIAGVVDDVRVTPGEAVEANELLFHLVAPGERWLSARVPEQWASQIRPEGDVAFQLLGAEDWRPLAGELVNVSRAVDERSRTVRVIWRVTEQDPALRVGLSVRVAIPIGEAVSGVVVPRRALVDVDGRPAAFVQRGGESFFEVPVRILAEGGGRAVVEGLSDGARVVTVGAYLVHLASRAAEGGAPHGHVH